MQHKLRSVLSLFTLERPQLTGPEVVAALRRPRSTVYRLLAACTESGFLDHDAETGRYRLGILLASLGDLARHSTVLQRIAAPVLRRLSEETGELVTLMVQSGRDGVTIDVVESYRPLMLPGLLGGHHPLHATAGGKALLAWQGPDAVGRTLRLPLRRYTAATIVSPTVLEQELAATRERGYATVDGEWFDEVVGVAAPIRNHRGEVVAALTLGSPRSRARPATGPAMARLAVAAAEEVSRALGYGRAARLGADAGDLSGMV